MGEFKLELQCWKAQFVSKSASFCIVWAWNLTDDLKNNRHLFYAASSFVHNFIAISEFKLKLQSGNTQFGSKSVNFCPLWPWSSTDDLEKQQDTSSMLLQALCIISKPWVNSTWSRSQETPNLGENRRFFVPRDLEIWRMTLKNNRAPLLCCFKRCASFDSHQWIQPGVIVGKRSIRVKIGDFLSPVTLKFDGWPWKTIGHLSYAASSFLHDFKAMGELKLELQSGNAQFGSKSTIFFKTVWPWNLADDLEKQ